MFDVDHYHALPSRLSVPFISSVVQSKLAIRAVLLNNEALLKSLIDDVDRVCSVR